MKTVEQVEVELKNHIQKAIKEGWKIIPGTTLDCKNKTCCAVGASMIFHGFPAELKDVAKVLNLPENILRLIAIGFDDFFNPKLNNVWEDLGYRLRQEYYITNQVNSNEIR